MNIETNETPTKQPVALSKIFWIVTVATGAIIFISQAAKYTADDQSVAPAILDGAIGGMVNGVIVIGIVALVRKVRNKS